MSPKSNEMADNVVEPRNGDRSRPQSIMSDSTQRRIMRSSGPLGCGNDTEEYLGSGGGSRRILRRKSSMALRDEVVIPDIEQVMHARRLNTLEDQLTSSLLVLQRKLTMMEKRMETTGGAALLPFQIRRAKQEKMELKREIWETQRTIELLNVMKTQLMNFIDMKKRVFQETGGALREEVLKLEQQIMDNEEPIRRGYIGRINMLQRYWPWRQLKELGDTSVGETFEEELAHGPRFRNVGIQNNIKSDYMSQQLHWLQEFAMREEQFRGHIRHLDMLVEDLNDINDLIESTITCSICGLLYEEPVLFWPCGHSFCVLCFDSLSIAPSLFRCPICGSIGSEGFVHNILLAETISKWMFKDTGYGDLQEPLNSIRIHLTHFRKEEITARIEDLKKEIQKSKKERADQSTSADTITISYRLY